MLDINTTNNLPITPRDFSGISMVTAKNDNKNNNKGDLQIKAMTVMNKYIDIICNLFTFRSFYSTFLSLSFEKINKLKTRKFQIANTAVTITFAHWISSTLEFTNVAIITEVATILKILSNA